MFFTLILLLLMFFTVLLRPDIITHTVNTVDTVVAYFNSPFLSLKVEQRRCFLQGDRAAPAGNQRRQGSAREVLPAGK